MSYINETDFVIENKKLVYPEIVSDGLQLYYDAKGKRDTDYHRDTLLDMSGNKNHGKLHNFAYEKHSGYKDGLVFDYIDDKLVRPTLDLKPDDFTFMLNGNIISFSSDGTVKRVQDGEVIESKGFNLIQNGDFVDGLRNWTQSNLVQKINDKSLESSGTGTSSYNHATQSNKNLTAEEGEKLYLSSKVKAYQPPVNIRLELRSTSLVQADFLSDVKENTWYQMSGIAESVGLYAGPYLRVLANYKDNESAKNATLAVKEVIAINLTKTFGAGNEPTKEEMDEIINRFGFIPNAQDLIDRIEYKGNDLGDMENIIDGLYKTEVLSGEEIYTDKADGDAVVHVDVDGNSWQEIDSNNLFNPSSSYYTNGINSGLVSWELNLKPNTIYTASTNMPDNNGTTKNVFFHIKDTVASSGLNGLSANKPFSLTTNSTGIVEITTRLLQYSGNIETIKNRDHWIKVEEGESATSFRGYPSPSPDYPVEIHSLNDFDVVSSDGGRNLVLNSSVLEASGLGATSGTRAEYQTINTGESYMDLEEGETITISFDIEMKIATKNPSLMVYNTNRPGLVGIPNVSVSNQIQGDVGEAINKRISFTTNATLRDSPKYSYNTLEFYSNYGSDNFYKISKLKVERGNKATPWTPAPKDIVESDNHPLIDRINLLLDEPLRSVGEVKDRLFRDSDGMWKIEKKISEIVLDGSEEWAGWTKRENTYRANLNYFPDQVAGAFTSNDTSQNSHFIVNQDSYSLDIVGQAGSKGVNGMYISIPKEIANSMDDFKKWLSENNVKVLYLTSEPLLKTLSQELQDKLNNLRSFEDSNYVYTADGSTNLLDIVPLLDNHWYPSSGVQQNPVSSNGQTATQEPLPVYPGVKIHLTKETTVDNYWRIVWVNKDNNLVRREVSTVNDLVLTAPKGAYGMRVSYPNGSNPVIKFDKSGITKTISENLKPTLHAKFLYNNWYKEDRVINNLMIYNRALTNEEMLQNYKTIKRRWGM